MISMNKMSNRHLVQASVWLNLSPNTLLKSYTWEKLKSYTGKNLKAITCSAALPSLGRRTPRSATWIMNKFGQGLASERLNNALRCNCSTWSIALILLFFREWEWLSLVDCCFWLGLNSVCVTLKKMQRTMQSKSQNTCTNCGPKLEPSKYWSAHNLICIMAASFFFKTNCRNFSRISLLIARQLHWCKTEVKYNSTILLRANLLGRFQKMAGFASKGSSSLDLSGIFPPIVTPFEDNEEISYEKLTENFSKWNDIPFRGRKEFIPKIEEIERFSFKITDQHNLEGFCNWA